MLQKDLPLDSALLQESRIPLKLAFNNNQGVPGIVSLWFSYEDGKLRCVTHRAAWVLKCLEHNRRVGFEISTHDIPYRGVRGHGSATVTPLGGSDLLLRLILKYLGTEDCHLARWLLKRSEAERVITIEIDQLSSWNYRDRMADLVT